MSDSTEFIEDGENQIEEGDRVHTFSNLESDIDAAHVQFYLDLQRTDKELKIKKIKYNSHGIEKGTYGQVSKITEEYCEFIDVTNRGLREQQISELTDLLGAILGFVRHSLPEVKADDLINEAKRRNAAKDAK